MSCCPENNIVPVDNGTQVCRSCGDVTAGDIWGEESQQAQFGDDICREKYVSEEVKQRNYKLAMKRQNHNMVGYISAVCRKCSFPSNISESALDIYDEYLVACPRVQSPEHIAIVCVVISCHKHNVECPVYNKNDLSKKLLKLTLYVPKYAVYFELLDIPGRTEFENRELPNRISKELKEYVQSDYQNRWPFEDCVKIVTKFLTVRQRIH